MICGAAAGFLAFAFALGLDLVDFFAAAFVFLPDDPALAAISSSACSTVTSVGAASLGRVALILPQLT